jgi:hypothetical protein
VRTPPSANEVRIQAMPVAHSWLLTVRGRGQGSTHGSRQIREPPDPVNATYQQTSHALVACDEYQASATSALRGNAGIREQLQIRNRTVSTCERK